jgi:hypothetical protein
LGADRLGHNTFNSLPAVGVVLLRLIHDLKEEMLRIGRGVVAGQGSPQVHKLLHAGGTLAKRGFVTALGMNVDDDRQMIVQDGLDDAVEFRHKRRGFAAVALPLNQRVSVNAEPHMIEAHRGHERNVLRGGEGMQALDRVVARRLRKPDAGIDAMAQVPGACDGQRVLRSLRAGCNACEEQGKHCGNSNRKQRATISHSKSSMLILSAVEVTPTAHNCAQEHADPKLKCRKATPPS